MLQPTLKPYTAVLFALGLSACVPLSFYHKEGVSFQTAKDAETECKVAAARDVPQRPVTWIVHRPPQPPRTVCDAAGKCVTEPGILFPPEFITEDANEGLRREAAALCMRKRGFTRVSLAACDPKETRAVVLSSAGPMPRLTKGTCAIRLKGGGVQIIAP